MTKLELSDLVKQVHRNAGIVLHHWAGNRQEWNDYHDGGSNTDYSGNATYFRAVAGMRDLPKSTDWDGHPVGLKYRWNNYPVSYWDREKSFVGVLHYPFPSLAKSKVEYPEGYSERDYIGADYKGLKDILTGRLTKEVPREGWLGVLGLTKTVELPPKKITKWEEPDPLSNYVTTDCQDQTNLLVLSVPGVFPERDSHGGDGRWGRQPQVLLFTTEELVKSVMEYLEHNPRTYHDFLQTLFPATKFPNVNKNMFARLGAYSEIRFADRASLVSLYKDYPDPRDQLEGKVFDYATKRVKVA